MIALIIAMPILAEEVIAADLSKERGLYSTSRLEPNVIENDSGKYENEFIEAHIKANRIAAKEHNFLKGFFWSLLGSALFGVLSGSIFNCLFGSVYHFPVPLFSLSSGGATAALSAPDIKSVSSIWYKGRSAAFRKEITKTYSRKIILDYLWGSATGTLTGTAIIFILLYIYAPSALTFWIG